MKTQIQVEKIFSFGGHSGPIYALSMGLNSHQFFSSGADGLVVKWDFQMPDKGLLLAKIPSSVYALCPIPGTDLMAVGQNFEGIHLINLSSGKEEASIKTGAAPIFDIKVFGDSLFVACGDGRVLRIHWPSMTIQAQVKYAIQHARCLAVSQNGETLIAGYSDSRVRIMNAQSLVLMQEMHEHENSIFSLAFSNNDDFLLSGSRDAFLKIWKRTVTGSYALYASAIAHLYTVNHIAFRPDGRYFATCSKDKSIKVWETEDFKLVKVIDRARYAGHGTSVNKLLWVDDEILLSASDDRSISCWKVVV